MKNAHLWEQMRAKAIALTAGDMAALREVLKIGSAAKARGLGGC